MTLWECFRCCFFASRHASRQENEPLFQAAASSQNNSTGQGSEGSGKEHRVFSFSDFSDSD